MLKVFATLVCLDNAIGISLTLELLISLHTSMV